MAADTVDAGGRRPGRPPGPAVTDPAHPAGGRPPAGDASRPLDSGCGRRRGSRRPPFAATSKAAHGSEAGDVVALASADSSLPNPWSRACRTCEPRRCGRSARRWPERLTDVLARRTRVPDPGSAGHGRSRPGRRSTPGDRSSAGMAPNAASSGRPRARGIDSERRAAGPSARRRHQRRRGPMSPARAAGARPGRRRRRQPADPPGS